MGKSYMQQCQDIVAQYRESGQPWPATMKAVAMWAVNRKMWTDQPAAIITRCAEDLARALREEFITDPQGRRVRSKHVAKVERNGQPMALWDDIRTAPRQHMAVAFQLRRQQIIWDCFQVKQDVDSYNENMTPSRPIQLPLDFTLDVLELELARDPNAYLPLSSQSLAVAQV